MKYYRVRDKITKQYVIDDVAYYCRGSELYVGPDGYTHKNLDRLKRSLRHLTEYETTYMEDEDGDIRIEPCFVDRFEIVECEAIDVPVELGTKFRIKDTLSNKYYAGRNKFDTQGTLYSSRGGANVALSKKSKSKVSQRGTVAGSVLYMKPEWANCKVLGVDFKDIKVVK